MSADRLDYLVRFSSVHSSIEGIPAPVLVSQLLLASAGIGGHCLTWRPRGVKTPRFGNNSVSFLSGPDDVPSWFLRQLEPLAAWHESSRRAARDYFAQIPSPEELRIRRSQAKLIRGDLPLMARELQRYQEMEKKAYQADFLVEVASKVGKLDVQGKGFGEDQLVLLYRDAAYEALNRRTGNGRLLLEAAANVGAGFRTTLHGWVSRKSFRKIVRSSPREDSLAYGWLIPADRLPMVKMNTSTYTKTALPLYESALALRYLGPYEAFQPNEVIQSILDQADHGWVVPEWCDSPHLRGLLRTDEELAWQLASTLRLISQANLKDTSAIHRLASFAIPFARWIRGVHCQEIRLIFPGPSSDPTERLSCDVADRLRQRPHTVRELCRAIRGSKSDAIQAVLQRMEAEGWVRREPRPSRKEGCQWSLHFSPLPDVSTYLSKFGKTGDFASVDWVGH